MLFPLAKLACYLCLRKGKVTDAEYEVQEARKSPTQNRWSPITYRFSALACGSCVGRAINAMLDGTDLIIERIDYSKVKKG